MRDLETLRNNGSIQVKTIHAMDISKDHIPTHTRGLSVVTNVYPF